MIGRGERFANSDGSSRQEELARCRPGQRVCLEREPDNPHDPLAVALYSKRGVQLGYLGRKDARWIAPLIDAGQSVVAIAADITPKGRPFSPLALTIRVFLEHEQNFGH